MTVPFSPYAIPKTLLGLLLCGCVVRFALAVLDLNLIGAGYAVLGGLLAFAVFNAFADAVEARRFSDVGEG